MFINLSVFFTTHILVSPGLHNEVSITKSTEQLVLGLKAYILAFSELCVILTFLFTKWCLVTVYVLNLIMQDFCCILSWFWKASGKQLQFKLQALSDGPVKLFASVIRAWLGGETTLLNNWSASQIKNSNVSLKGTRILLCQHGRNSF